MSREFLSDEIALLSSDVQILRSENELLKMTTERKTEENRILRQDLIELRARYEEKVMEAAAIRTVLENIGQVISHGLQRYMERRTLKNEHVQERTEPNKAVAPRQPDRPPGAPFRPGGTAPVSPPRPPVVLSPRPEDNTPSPAFLRDSRIPNNDFHRDAGELSSLADSIGNGTTKGDGK